MIIEKIGQANTLDELRTAARALDRVVMWSYWGVPMLYSRNQNVSYWNRFGIPTVQASYMDIDTMIESVKKTHRFVVVHEAPRTCGFGAELMSQVVERAFYYLEAQPVRVTGYDTPFPYTLENEYLPRAPRILKALRETKAAVA